MGKEVERVTRTNHQSVMECGGVRPAHPVGHPLELKEGRYEAFLQKGNLRLPVRREVPGVPHTTAGFFPPA